MCYRNGKFEDSMGECRVYNYRDFRKNIGYESCFICSGGDCEESADLYEELVKSGEIQKMVDKAKALDLLWY